jgi:hypothetical protein
VYHELGRFISPANRTNGVAVRTANKPANVGYINARSKPPLHHVRRIGDKILLAFNDACDNDELEVAALLLVEYERVVTRPPIGLGTERRREIESLVAAHSRLWEALRGSLSESSERTEEPSVQGA